MNITLEALMLYGVIPASGATFMLVTGWHIKLLVYLVRTVHELHTQASNHHERITVLEKARPHIHHFERRSNEPD